MEKLKVKKFSVSKLHRFNRNPRSKKENSVFLDNYFKMLKKALELNESGRLTRSNMEVMFRWRKETAVKIISDLKEGLHIYFNLEAEIYFKLQEILIELNNGRPMRMDIFLNLIVTWFIYTYYNRTENMTEGDPFFVPKEIKKQNKMDRKKLINKFDKMFKQYYGTIINIS